MLKSLISEYRENLYFGLALGEEGYENLPLAKKVELFDCLDSVYYYLVLLDKNFEDLSGVLGSSYFALEEMFNHILNDEATATAWEMM